jgi:O-antigen ligase
LLRHKFLVLYAASFALLCIILPVWALTVITLLTFIILIRTNTEDFLIILIIIAYLSFTGPELIFLRSWVNVFSFILLIFLFMKKYGFNFGKYPRVPSGILFLVTFLFLSFLTSTLANGAQPNSLTAVFRLLIFFLICYFLYSFIIGKKQVFNYLIALFIVFLILCGSIYYEVANAGLVLFGLTGLFTRYSGLYENPNYVGILVMVVSSFVTVLFFRNLLVTRAYKIFASFLSLNIIVISILINSRAALLGLIVSLIVIYSILKKTMLIKIFIIGSFIFIVILQIPKIQNLFDLFIRLETIGEREHLWNAGLAMFGDFPFFGVGPDMFRNYFFNYIPSSAGVLVQAVYSGGSPHPHNFFLFLASENGFLGILAGVSIFVSLFYYSIKSIVITRNKDREYFLISVACLGICSGFFIRTFSDVEGILNYGYITRDLPFWLVLMISIHIYQSFKDPKRNA